MQKIVFFLLIVSLAQLTPACGDSNNNSICDELEPTGNTVSDVAEDWTLMDADGVPHSLHDFCGKVIYLKLGAKW